MPLTSSQARAVIAAAEAKASALGVPMIIAVVDAGVYLKACTRMDCAVLASIDCASEFIACLEWQRVPSDRSATEVRLGNLRNPREVRDVEWLSEGAVHRVSSAEHPAIALFYSAHGVLY